MKFFTWAIVVGVILSATSFIIEIASDAEAASNAVASP